MYKLVAIDLDGTLLDDKKLIHPDNIKVISQVKKLGIKVVIATGRPLIVVKSILDQLGITDPNDYCVTLNGVLVQRVSTQEIVCSESFDASLFKRIYSLMKLNPKLFLHTFSPQYDLVANKKNEYSDIECYHGILSYEEFDFSKIKEQDRFYKAVITGDPKHIDHLEETLDPIFYSLFTVVRTLPCILEFLPLGTNKGYGLLSLAKLLNIKPSEIIAIGDEHNDLEMLKAVGMPIAMENAIPEVKEICQMITLSNNAAGVAYALKKLIIEGIS